MIKTVLPDLPDGKRYAVCLSFDFDTFSFRVGRMDPYSPTQISQSEFGNVGAHRILDLLTKNGIKSTWFIPGYTIESYTDTVKEIVNKGHEIAHHNYLHETPRGLSRESESSIMDKANNIIEKISGKKARGYRAPSWDLSENTLDLVIEKGFLYDSSLMAHDYLPYLVRKGDEARLDGGFKFGENTELIEMPISWSLEDYPVFEMDEEAPGGGLREAKGVLRNWIADFDYMTKHLDSGVFTLTTHPQVIGRGHRIEVLEDMINHISERDDVVFMSMENVASSCRSKI